MHLCLCARMYVFLRVTLNVCVCVCSCVYIHVRICVRVLTVFTCTPHVMIMAGYILQANSVRVTVVMLNSNITFLVFFFFTSSFLLFSFLFWYIEVKGGKGMKIVSERRENFSRIRTSFYVLSLSLQLSYFFSSILLLLFLHPSTSFCHCHRYCC